LDKGIWNAALYLKQADTPDSSSFRTTGARQSPAIARGQSATFSRHHSQDVKWIRPAAFRTRLTSANARDETFWCRVVHPRTKGHTSWRETPRGHPLGVSRFRLSRDAAAAVGTGEALDVASWLLGRNVCSPANSRLRLPMDRMSFIWFRPTSNRWSGRSTVDPGRIH